MTARITISMPDDLEDRINAQLEYGDNRSELIRDLIERGLDDIEGADTSETQAPTAGHKSEELDSKNERTSLIDTMPGRGNKPESRADAVLAMRDRLRERGAADWQDLLDTVDPDAVGYADRESFWKNVGRKGLKRFDQVRAPPRDSDEWTWVG